MKAALLPPLAAREAKAKLGSPFDRNHATALSLITRQREL